MTHDPKLIEKIKAILRKAEESKNPSEAERDTAMRMANRLLLKHGLTMQDVGTIDDPANGRDFEHESLLETDGDTDAWRGLLLFRIARVYFCNVYRTPGRGKSYRWMIVGRSDYVRTAQTMFEWIAPQLEYEFTHAMSKMTQHRRYARRYALHAARRKFTYEGAPKIADIDDDELASIGLEHWEHEVEEIGEDQALVDMQILLNCNELNAQRTRAKVLKEDIAPNAPANLGVWRRSFFEAAIIRVHRRLHEMMKQEVTTLGEPGTALVKNEREDLKRFLESLDLNLRANQSNRQVDAGGRASGDAAGKRVDVSAHNKVKKVTRKELSR